MKKIAYFLKFIAMGSFSLILTACYGVRFDAPYRIKDGLVSIKNPSGEPIPGLTVVSYDYYTDMKLETSTDGSGFAEINFGDNSLSGTTLHIIDRDELDNKGFFCTETITIDPSTLDHGFLIDIEMTEAVKKDLVLIAKDVNNNPISNLHVMITESSSQLSSAYKGSFRTDDSGQIVFAVDTEAVCYTLKIIDDDGSVNGSFKEKSINKMPQTSESEILVNVVLDSLR